MNNSELLRHDYAAMVGLYVRVRVYYRDEEGCYRHWGNLEGKDIAAVPAAIDCFCYPQVKGYMIIGETGQGDELLECGDTIEQERGLGLRRK
jgi:hypothetical protein